LLPRSISVDFICTPTMRSCVWVMIRAALMNVFVVWILTLIDWVSGPLRTVCVSWEISGHCDRISRISLMLCYTITYIFSLKIASKIPYLRLIWCRIGKRRRDRIKSCIILSFYTYFAVCCWVKFSWLFDLFIILELIKLRNKNKPFTENCDNFVTKWWQKKNINFIFERN
jgi:hypothetical protein